MQRILILLTFIAISFTLLNCSNSVSSNEDDKQYIAYSEHINGPGFKLNLYGLESRKSEVVESENAYGSSFVFFKNKPQLLYVTTMDTPGDVIKVYDIASKQKGVLWKGNPGENYSIGFLSIAENNKIVFILYKSMNEQSLCSINRDGTDFKVLANGNFWNLKLSNENIYFRSSIDDTIKLYSLNINGGEFKQVTNSKPEPMQYIVSKYNNDIYLNYGKDQENLYKYSNTQFKHTKIYTLDSLIFGNRSYRDYYQSLAFSQDQTQIAYNNYGNMFGVINLSSNEVNKYKIESIDRITQLMFARSNYELILTARVNNAEEIYLFNRSTKSIEKLDLKAPFSFTISNRYTK